MELLLRVVNGNDNVGEKGEYKKLKRFAEMRIAFLFSLKFHCSEFIPIS